MVPQGQVDRIDYFVFVPPETYFALQTNAERTHLARTVGKVNAALAGVPFVCVGPGRWGSSNADLGVPIEYGDIYHARALVEVTGQGVGMGMPPEPSLGTHFFQDLLEAQIYPLGLYLDDPHSVFNRAFFYDLPNHLAEFIPADEALLQVLRVIRVADLREGYHARLVMNDEKGIGMAYLQQDSVEVPEVPAEPETAAGEQVDE